MESEPKLHQIMEIRWKTCFSRHLKNPKQFRTQLIASENHVFEWFWTIQLISFWQKWKRVFKHRTRKLKIICYYLPKPSKFVDFQGFWRFLIMRSSIFNRFEAFCYPKFYEHQIIWKPEIKKKISCALPNWSGPSPPQPGGHLTVNINKNRYSHSTSTSN